MMCVPFVVTLRLRSGLKALVEPCPKHGPFDKLRANGLWKIFISDNVYFLESAGTIFRRAL